MSLADILQEQLQSWGRRGECVAAQGSVSPSRCSEVKARGECWLSLWERGLKGMSLGCDILVFLQNKKSVRRRNLKMQKEEMVDGVKFRNTWEGVELRAVGDWP